MRKNFKNLRDKFVHFCRKSPEKGKYSVLTYLGTYVGEFGTDFVYQIIPAANNHRFWAAGIIWYTKLVPNSPTYVKLYRKFQWIADRRSFHDPDRFRSILIDFDQFWSISITLDWWDRDRIVDPIFWWDRNRLDRDPWISQRARKCRKIADFRFWFLKKILKFLVFRNFTLPRN